MSRTKKHRDSLGEVDVPAGVLYGPQTARAVANFPISGWPMPGEFIAALGLIKQAAATAHKNAGMLAPARADAIIAAAGEVAAGKWNDQFPVDVFQTGSGTSTNMNANEVIAHRAGEILGGEPVHPNDDVNMGQSSNDVIPTAMHVAAAVEINKALLPALAGLQAALAGKAREFDDVIKIGRTHMMDAVPVRLGQEFAGYAAQVAGAISRIENAAAELCELAIGGTAVGTGLNAPEGFSEEVCRFIAKKTSLPFRETANHFAAQSCKDAVVYASGVLRMAAASLGKIASDIRLMSSGPRCGLGELVLPSLQPGSSIMPGKVNPVICESVIQVACQVAGCDAAISAGAAGGVGSILELNVAMPMMAANLLNAIKLLANVAKVFNEKCISGIKPDGQRCRELVEQSLAMITVLAPKIGYNAAADIAKEAYTSGKTIRQLCMEKKILPKSELDALLDAAKQTGK